MYRLRRPHPAADMTIDFRCGCSVTWWSRTDFRGGRQESCAVHEAPNAVAERAQILNVASVRKRTLLSLGW